MIVRVSRLLCLYIFFGCQSFFMEDDPVEGKSGVLFLESLGNYVPPNGRSLNIDFYKKIINNSESMVVFDAMIRYFVKAENDPQFRILAPYVLSSDTKEPTLYFDPVAMDKSLINPTRQESIIQGNIRNYSKVAYLRIESLREIRSTVQSAVFKDVIFPKLRSPNVQALILDLRLCHTGFVEDLDAILPLFLSQKQDYLRYRLKLGSGSDDFGPWRDIYAEPSHAAWSENVPIVVLMGRKTKFAAEWLSMGVERSSYTVLIGDTTAGYVSIPQYFQLPNGYVYQMPTWDVKDRFNQRVEGRGVIPEITIETKHTKEGKDSTVFRAIRIFTERYGLKPDF